jgi:probable HAF family extracellular repeat protein
VNNLGQVAGTNFTGTIVSPQSQRAFRWSATTGIVELSPGLQTGASGVNDSGQVSGIIIGSDHVSAFRSSPNGSPVSITDIGIGTGIHYSQAGPINANGQVIGLFGGFSDGDHVFRTGPNGIISDPSADLGPGGYGYAINDIGQVTGILSGTQHAYRTTATGNLSGPGVDLGTLGGARSTGFAINASGQVVGYSNIATGQNHAFLTSPNGRVSDPGADIGLPPGAARVGPEFGVNTLGIVVGSSEGGTLGQHAMRYDGTGWQDLNDLIPGASGWTLLIASGISDTGYITGYGIIGGATHGYLLTPVAVPEPSSLAFAAIALAGGWAARRRLVRRSYFRDRKRARNQPWPDAIERTT